MRKKVTFSLDSRSDRRGEHPIRLYVRSCDGHRFQSTVGYSINSDRWDPDRQRAIVDESNAVTNAKGIPLSEINKRIDAISLAFDDLTSKPGAATKSALASVLDQITIKSIDGAIYDPKDAADTMTDASLNRDHLAVIRDFLSNFHDFASKDRRKGFVNVYRPEWHRNPVRFWFNPPFGKKKVSRPTTSGAIMMKVDGTILVQEQRLHLLTLSYGNPGQTYELNSCLGSSLSNFVIAIDEYRMEEDSFLPEDFSRDAIASSFVIPQDKSRIGGCTFENCTNLRAVSIPDGVTEIGQSAFAGCLGLTEVQVPDSVKTIGIKAFMGCTGLRKAYLPNVTKIEDSVFEGCASLTEVHIPDCVTRIGSSAFKDCRSLTEIDLPDSVISVGNEAFMGCSSLNRLSVPHGLDLSKCSLSDSVFIEERDCDHKIEKD